MKGNPMNLAMEDLGFIERSTTLGNSILLYCELETKAPFLDRILPFLLSQVPNPRIPRSTIERSMPRAFLDKSTFHISKRGVGNSSHDHFPQATVGPYKPHATSKAWQDVPEKQVLDVSYLEIERVQSKLEEMHKEEKDVQNNLKRKLCGHLLFFGITMGLLAEIINSRQNGSF